LANTPTIVPAARHAELPISGATPWAETAAKAKPQVCQHVNSERDHEITTFIGKRIRPAQVYRSWP